MRHEVVPVPHRQQHLGDGVADHRAGDGDRAAPRRGRAARLKVGGIDDGQLESVVVCVDVPGVVAVGVDGHQAIAGEVGDAVIEGGLLVGVRSCSDRGRVRRLRSTRCTGVGGEGVVDYGSGRADGAEGDAGREGESCTAGAWSPWSPVRRRPRRPAQPTVTPCVRAFTVRSFCDPFAGLYSSRGLRIRNRIRRRCTRQRELCWDEAGAGIPTCHQAAGIVPRTRHGRGGPPGRIAVSCSVPYDASSCFIAAGSGWPWLSPSRAPSSAK